MSSRPRVIVTITAFAAAAAVALSGCSSSGGGGGGKPTTGSSPTSSSSSTASGKDAAAAALVPASIAKKGTLTFALDASYPPDEFSKPGSSTIIGFDADLAPVLAAKLGLKASLQNVKFDNIIPGLQSGKYDVGLSSFTDTKEREKTVDFVTYFQAGEGFYIKAGSGKKFDGLSSLCGHTVSVETGTTEQTDAQAQAKKCKVTVLSFADQNAANLAVSSGRADVGFADSQVAEYIVKQSGGQFANSGTAFEVAPYGIALPKSNGMAKAVLAAMKAVIDDGTYKTILAKWGISDGAISTPAINGATS